MKQISKFLQLPRTDRRLLVRSALLLSAVQLGLSLLPFQKLRLLLARMTSQRTFSQQRGETSPERVVWAVAVASRYVPGVKCLASALVTQVLLARRGYAAQVRLGISRGEGGQLEAHAWVEDQGKILIGDLKDLSRYLTFPLWEAEIS